MFFSKNDKNQNNATCLAKGIVDTKKAQEQTFKQQLPPPTPPCDIYFSSKFLFHNMTPTRQVKQFRAVDVLFFYGNAKGLSKDDPSSTQIRSTPSESSPLQPLH